MKKIHLFLFFLILVNLNVLSARHRRDPLSGKQIKYELTICCITRDEVDYLPEWIDFHLKQGVEHFYVYDNFTKADLTSALQDYMHKGLIDIVSWPYEHDDELSWVHIQFAAYKDYLRKHGIKTQWCAFIDTDEFLFCPDGQNLRDFLKNYTDYQELLVCWILYGTSNIWEAPKGKLIQTLFYRAQDHFNLATKPIVQTRYVTDISHPHYIQVRNPLKVVDENYQVVRAEDQGFCPKMQSVNKIRINHYALRDKKFFEEVKIPRYLKRGIGMEAILNLEALTNSVYDDCILKCIP